MKRVLIIFIVLLLLTAVVLGIYFSHRVKVDVFLTSTNLKSLEIENSIIALQRKFEDRVDFNIHLVTTKNDQGEFLSYNQDPQNPSLASYDVVENQIQLCVKEKYPAKFLEYLELRNQNIDDPGSEKYMEAVGIDPKRIQKAIEDKEGEKFLNQEIEAFEKIKSEKNIEAIPVILIDGKIYEGETSILSLGAAIVKPLLRGKKDQLKDSVRIKLGESVNVRMPWSKKSVAGIYECYSDIDCNDKVDKDGFCKEVNTEDAFCRYEDPKKVDLLVLTDEKCVSCHVDKAIKLLKNDFKGLEAREVDLDSDEGKEIVAKYSIKGLPVFIFEENVTKSLNFERYVSSELLSKVSEKENRYVLLKTETRKMLNREFQDNKLTLFVNAHNPQSVSLEKALISRKKQLETEGKESFNIELRHILKVEEKEDGSVEMKVETPAGIAETEESVRQVVVLKYYPDKFFDYLTKRNEDLNKDFVKIFQELGIDEALVSRATKAEGEALIRENGKLAFDLKIQSLPVFLWENQVVILSVEDLKQIEQFSELSFE